MTTNTNSAVNTQVEEQSKAKGDTLASKIQHEPENVESTVIQEVPVTAPAKLAVPVGMFSKVQQLNQEKTLNQYQGQVGKSFYTPATPPGTFFAVPTDAVFDENAITSKGKRAVLILTWTVYVPRHNHPDEEIELKQFYYKTPSPQAPYVWLLSKLLGYDSRQGFSISDFLGIPCTIEVIHDYKENGNVYAEIAQLTIIQLEGSPTQLSI